VTTIRESLQLPEWSRVSDRRCEHIARVTAMLLEWAQLLQLDEAETTAWRDAGRLHDALRDADESELRGITDDRTSPVGILHGPAAARLLERDGERRKSLLDAVRWHTVGFAGWDRCGRALYMADFLEPGRTFARADRAYLASHVPRDFETTFRQVVKERIEWTVREGKALFPETVAVWNGVR
jgi:HD superfamily phosphohydrolase YqeK